MSQGQDDVEYLNQLLKGRHMGLDSINDYAQASQDADLRSHLSTMAGVYERQIGEIKQKVRDLGGLPEESRGVAGIMRTVKTQGQLLVGEDSVTMVSNLLQGEQMGIDQEEKILLQLSPATRDLVDRQLQENRQVLQELHELDHRYHHLG